MTRGRLITQLWGIASLLESAHTRIPIRDVVLPLILLRRLDQLLLSSRSEVLETHARLGPEAIAELKQASRHQFYNTAAKTFGGLGDGSQPLEASLRGFLDSFDPGMRKVFGSFELDRSLAALEKTGLLRRVYEAFCEIDLHPARVSNDEVAEAFDEVLWKLVKRERRPEGEHSTPPDVAELMASLLVQDTSGRDADRAGFYRVHDPCAGFGQTLIAVKNALSTEGTPEVRLYGQEISLQALAVCQARLLLRGEEEAAELMLAGDVLHEDRHRGAKFDLLVADPPFGATWKRQRSSVTAEADSGSGRFRVGTPRVSDSQLLFLQHLVHHMQPQDKGFAKIAIIMSGSPLYTGGPASGEDKIRTWLLENDFLEAVITLPSGVFPHTGIETYLCLLTNRKSPERAGMVQLIDGQDSFTSIARSSGRSGGKVKALRAQDQAEITELYLRFEEGDRCRILPNSAFGYQQIVIQGPDVENGAQRGRSETDEQLKRVYRLSAGQDPDAFLREHVHRRHPEARITRREVGYAIDRIEHLGFRLSREVDALEAAYQPCQILPLGQVASVTRRPRSEAPSRKSTDRTIRSLNDLPPFSQLEVIPDEDRVTDQYLLMFFQTAVGIRLLEAVGEPAFGLLGPRDVWSLPVPVPTIREQAEVVEMKRHLDEVSIALGEVEAELAANPQSLPTVKSLVTPLLNALNRLSEADQVRELVRKGESKRVEFKETFSLDVRKETKEKYIEESALKTIVAFLNSDGGDLLVGVADDGSITGLQEEITKFYGRSLDNLLLHVKNRINNRIGPQWYPLIDQVAVAVDDDTVLRFCCSPSERPVFLDDEDFFVRTNPATDRLSGRKLAEYLQVHFGPRGQSNQSDTTE